jgi:hypothetical protein
VSRASFWFIAFLVLLAGALLWVALLLGPNRLAFLFHGDRHGSPFVMVNLLDPVDGEDAAALLSATLERLGGEARWVVRTERVVEGSNADHWPLIAFIEHPSRAHFTDQLGLLELRAFTGIDPARLAASAVFDVQASPPTLGDQRAYALRFTTAASEASGADYAARWLDDDAALLARYGGGIAWHARLNPLATPSAASFDYLTVMSFDSIRGRDLWLADATRATHKTLQARLWRRDVLLAVAPLGIIDEADSWFDEPFEPEPPREREPSGDRAEDPQGVAVPPTVAQPAPIKVPDAQTRTVPNSSNSPRFGIVDASTTAMRR